MRLEKAAKEEGIELQVVHHAFELQPSHGASRPSVEVLGERYGREAALRMTRHVRELAEREGITLRTDEAVSANTFDAHRLILWAQRQEAVHPDGVRAGTGMDLLERITQAHFGQLADVADHAVLAPLAAEAGLDRAAARNLLDSTGFAKEVRDDEAIARELGIGGVPFFILDGRLGVSGAQEVETFRRVLRQARDTAGKDGSDGTDRRAWGR